MTDNEMKMFQIKNPSLGCHEQLSRNSKLYYFVEIPKKVLKVWNHCKGDMDSYIAVIYDKAHISL